MNMPDGDPEPETGARAKRQLPKQQLAILAICRFSEPLASTSLLPYLPEMISSFNIPDSDVGRWSGLCAAVFSLCQAVMGIPWGRASDRYGRKPAILFGLFITMVTSLLWGFSTSLPMAIAARAIAGAGNGNVGIIRTTVAEMVPYKELQPLAFSLMPLVWNVGCIFGPSMGGTLANPLGIEPGHRPTSGSLLEVYPYALPNLVSAVFFAIGITTGVLFLRETLQTKKDQRDWGLVAGRKLTYFLKRVLRSVQNVWAGHATDSEREPLLKARTDEEHVLPDAPSTTVAPPAWSKVLTRQAVLNLVAYGILAMHTMSYDQILPVMMYEKQQHNTISGNPLQFFGGFGLKHWQIGIITTCYGVFSMIVQFFFFPPIANRYGVLYCFKWTVIVFPIAYLLTPFAILMPTQETQVATCFVIQLVKGVCAIFAFPCSTILLTNCASSLRTLGTLNGVATTMSALGRAFGPAAIGALYSEGYRRRYAIAPWWFLAIIGVAGAIPVWFLVEGEGFGDDEPEADAGEEVIDESTIERAGMGSGVEVVGDQPGPVLMSGTSSHAESDDHLLTQPANQAAHQNTIRVINSPNGQDASNHDHPAQQSATTAHPSAPRIISPPRHASPGNKTRTRRFSSSLGASLGSTGSFPE